MASLVARTAHTSRSLSRAVAGSWRDVGGSLSSRVWPYTSYTGEGLDSRVPPTPEASSAASPLVDIPLSLEFSPAVSKTVTIGADRPISFCNAYRLRTWEGSRVYPTPHGLPSTILEPQLSETTLNQEVIPVDKCMATSRNVPEKSCHDSPRQGFVFEKELPIRSAHGRGNIDLSGACTTKEAIAYLKQGLYINSYMIVEILKRCSQQKDLVAARQLHECIVQSGLDKNPFVMNTLLNVYIRCGRLQEARRIFDGLGKKDVVTWRIMIAAYAENARPGDAMEIFNRVRREGGQPNEITCLSILKACASRSALKWGKELHAYIRHTGLAAHVRVGTSLVQMYARCGCITEARRVFETLTNRDIVTWNVMIGAYAETGIGVEAYRLFARMKREGFIPNAITCVSILNASASAGALEWVKQVHDHSCREGLDIDLRVGNSFVHMYAKSGSIHDARLVFDRMKERDVTTWTIMIGAHAESGCGEEAYRLFLQMKREGFVPNAITYMNILNASACAGALEWVKEVHGHARRAGLESDLRVGSALVHMYAKSGSICDARLVFERMEKRDVITWNTMIGAYAEDGCGGEAYRLFLQMKLEGFVPNAITYINILNASANAGALEWVKEIHAHARTAGLDSDFRVGNALIHMYGKSGSIDDARLVFDKMEKRDITTWNTVIGAYAESGCGVEAYRFFLQMKREGFKPDAITYVSILNASASKGALEWVKEVHGGAVRSGLESDLRVGNALVHMYANSGSFDDARLVFDRMKKRDVTTWTILIGAYAESRCGEEAYRLFLEMKREGFVPNAITYLSILNSSASAGALEWVKEVHGHACREGQDSDLRVGNALVHMYAKCGSIYDARLVFDRMEKRDVITWNTMIRAYAESGCGEEAYRLFLQMKLEGFIADAITYMNILNASASAGALVWVKEVHGHARNAGLDSDFRVGNALVNMYGKIGSIDDARLVFDRMEQRNVTTWNTVIGAYAESGCGVEAYRLFVQMKREGFKPDAVTYVRILNASASTGALDWVKEVHRDAVRSGLESDLRVGNALVRMYAKSGSIDDARLTFDRMEKRDVVTWNVMLGGLAQHGCGHEALELFRNMNAESVKPNEVSFLAVLSACCHVGLLDDGRRLFLGMKQDFGIEPTVMHYTCMVDLLGRAGHLEEAKVFMDDMPVEANGVTWNALLGACRTYGNVELGELATRESLKLEPTDAAAYILLSNIYAAAGEWEKVLSVRTMMQERGVAKEPGRSWIEVDSKIHEFTVGDTSHPEAKAIYAELNKLTEKLKAEGYIPDTQLVLRNIDEKDKELALCSHSEKLAIVYGLMRTPPEKPILVYKNLRMCSDCHRATRLISKVSGREITARDANRFHHFKDGLCSCGDFW